MTMGVEDLVNQGKDFLDQNKDKIAEALRSEQAVDGAVRDNVDKSIGNE